MGLGAFCFESFWCEWTTEDSWFTGRFNPWPTEKFGGLEGLRLHTVDHTRVFPVSNSTLEEAISLLEKQPAVVLTDSEAAHFLPDSGNLNPDTMLQNAAAEAIREAERGESSANYVATLINKDRKSADILQDHRQDYLKNARISRRVAEHALSLLGRLKPYLVRGVALNEGSRGRFVLYFDGTELLVEHSLRQTDLSHRLPMKRRPVVVFLEQAPTKVTVTMNVWEAEWLTAMSPAE